LTFYTCMILSAVTSGPPDLLGFLAFSVWSLDVTFLSLTSRSAGHHRYCTPPSSIGKHTLISSSSVSDTVVVRLHQQQPAACPGATAPGHEH
jgi:hypothetical protein